MASDLKNQIQSDLNASRKDRDKVRTLVLSTVLSEVRNKEIEIGGDLDDEGIVQVISRMIKQRKDASAQFRDAGRAELADQEDGQVAVLADYLPYAEIFGLLFDSDRQPLVMGRDSRNATRAQLIALLERDRCCVKRPGV